MLRTGLRGSLRGTRCKVAAPATASNLGSSSLGSTPIRPDSRALHTCNERHKSVGSRTPPSTRVERGRGDQPAGGTRGRRCRGGGSVPARGGGVMTRILVMAVLGAALVVGVQPAEAGLQTFSSNTTWHVYTGVPPSGPLG